MKRILHYVGKMDFGGMEAMIMNLFRNIDRTQWQFDFAVHVKERGCYEDEIEKLGGHIYRFPMMRTNPLRYKKTWVDFWQAHKGEYEVFQMHTNSLANIIALQTATKAGVPKRIVHAHSAYANKGKLQWINDVLHKYHRHNLDKYANIKFACSELAANWMFGEGCLQDGTAILMNNGVDYKRFEYNEEKRMLIRKQLGLSDKLILVQVGSFLPVKNHVFTIKIVEQLIKSGFRDFVCLFLGGGSLKEELESLVQDARLENYIIFAGSKSNIEDYLSASDIFLMPSLYEGMPLSVVEAQASGLECLISDNITKMAKVTNNVEYLSIENIDSWIEKIRCFKLNKNRLELCIDDRLNIKRTVGSYTNFLSR